MVEYHKTCCENCGPTSVASGAVGVISLGLQVSQSLVKYCSQCKSFNKDIITFKSKAETLNAILQQLGDKLKPFEQEKWTLPTSVIETIEKCEAGLRGLDKELQKHGRNTISNRIAYPFIKDSLTLANAMLDSLQNNLTLALHNFSVDTYEHVIELSQTTRSTRQKLCRSLIASPQWLRIMTIRYCTSLLSKSRV
ncbi:3245108f-0d16-452b-a1c3-99e7ce851c86-CDS [Sclerotinia trifoliorum]|uniref:3245108f-0d16-452b-a1c3-99e7ce851c86-CDS n=1 Tax=Sclerotinia trifoliorum TaxID=28548 RepID=A0A8H2W4Q9_9HELO|nr:3245108f-0d16-452b-a1c3-99e7ce851c86-CDS [Sclerotinia trifoliorum]